MSKFTNEVKLFIKNNAITQTELAEHLGVKKQYFSRYLNNEFDSINLELKCKQFMLNYNS